MTLFDVAVAKKLAGGGGGGGGSSDFSTAEVTIIGDEGVTNFYLPVLPYVVTDGIDCAAFLSEQEENSKTYSIALYKGKAFGHIYDNIVSTTGGVTYEDGTITISGDGTLTIRPE